MLVARSRRREIAGFYTEATIWRIAAAMLRFTLIAARSGRALAARLKLREAERQKPIAASLTVLGSRCVPAS
jgi:hypothetical protein